MAGTVINVTVEHCNDNDCTEYDYTDNEGFYITSIVETSPLVGLYAYNFTSAVPLIVTPENFDQDPYIFIDDSQMLPTDEITYQTELTVSNGAPAMGWLHGVFGHTVDLYGYLTSPNPSYVYLTSDDYARIVSQIQNYTFDVTALYDSVISSIDPASLPSLVWDSYESFALGAVTAVSFCFACFWGFQ